MTTISTRKRKIFDILPADESLTPVHRMSDMSVVSKLYTALLNTGGFVPLDSTDAANIDILRSRIISAATSRKRNKNVRIEIMQHATRGIGIQVTIR